jgi:beta-fructofuranosidase
MQYFKPNGKFFVGDCMPFYHEGLFHLFYLLDENHHQGNNGLGGHQWAHSSSHDLINWEHHEMAVPLTEEWESSICTGSVFFHNDIYHAYYAVRKSDKSQHICHSTSTDCMTFQKVGSNPIFSAPEGFNAEDCRDPFVFQDSKGLFQMLITSKLSDFPLDDRGGCLMRMTSKDLMEWKTAEPFLIPGGKPGYGCIPECSDIFQIGDWYYLVFGLGLATHYRMSRSPMDPWLTPNDDILGSRLCAVMKTAEFKDERRIGVCWIGTRRNNQNNGGIQWGGNVIFREIIQASDGTLETSFPKEMIPSGQAIKPKLEILTSGADGDINTLNLNAPQSQEVVALRALPNNYRLSCRMKPENNCHRFGVGLFGSGQYKKSNDLAFMPGLQSVNLEGESITAKDLDKGFSLEIICKDDIIDVCIDNRYTIINRLPEFHGDSAFFFCENGTLEIKDIHIESL